MFQVDRVVSLWKEKISRKILDGQKVFIAFHFASCIPDLFFDFLSDFWSLV